MSVPHDGPPNPLSLRFVEEMWRAHRHEPNALPVDWREFFRRWSFSDWTPERLPEAPGFFDVQPQPAPVAGQPPTLPNGSARRINAPADHLVDAFRCYGHLKAQLDPLARPRPESSELLMTAYGLTDADLDKLVAPRVWRRAGELALRQLLADLHSVYCGSVGYQFMHLETTPRRWLRRRIERTYARPLSRRSQLRILNRLSAAAAFEQFVRKKYIGAKTFSLAGAESLVPLLDTVVERAAGLGAQEIVLAMAHRGRLNVLVNILGQRPLEIFHELADRSAADRLTSGDVRYHLGYSQDWLSQRGDRIHLSLSFNPSHLEYVNPVALGRMRAKQQRSGDTDRRRGMAVLLHGDASFSGEGVVQESLNLALLAGYTTGGTIHVVVDNQLGFTTDPQEGRSTTYASDVALGFGIPVFHVNGDDAEAVFRVSRLAVEYRQKFGRDVVIDLHCFRRWGHNEADEPSFTQPQMYRLIEQHPDVRQLYAEQLVSAGRISAERAKRLEATNLARLQSELDAAGRTRHVPRTSSLGGVWSGYLGGPEPADDTPATAVTADKLQQLLKGLTTVPGGFQLHPKVAQGLARRAEMIEGKRPLDWATCELLALASLSVEGHPVRLTGQDTARGTFSQRHAVWHDVESGKTHLPLAHLAPNQGPVEVINSPLCEAASLGFEYGFSLDYPEALVAWEAQFGDFWNAAQVIFDQFLASAEDKWSRLSGLVLLLPHGFEGQGPEHSSARLERFLVSAADDNYQVVVPSTPAQYFHCLRRQVLRKWRKPLVVLTPKSLLRHHDVVSSWDELAAGGFQPVLDDRTAVAKQVKRVVLCMGKLYYELLKARQEQQRSDLALVRIEQFYPFPTAALKSALAQFADKTPIVWCQEEPANMGAWRYLQALWPIAFPERMPLAGITRSESASPATGSHAVHRLEQQELIAQALDIPT